MEDLFLNKNRFLKLGPIRGVYFVLFAFFFLLTEICREIYRPYIYRNRIDDFGFADVVGNLLGTVAIIFFDLGIIHATRRQGIRLVAFVTLGVAVYELLHREDIPKKVTLNEAIEVGKKYGSENTSAFLNGILDRVSRINDNQG